MNGEEEVYRYVTINNYNSERIKLSSTITDDEDYYYTKTTTTTSNVIYAELTKADVWMADYEFEITVGTETGGSDPTSEALDDKVVVGEEDENGEISGEVYTEDNTEFTYGSDNLEAIKENEDFKEAAYEKADKYCDDYDSDGNKMYISDAKYVSMSGVSHEYIETHINRTIDTESSYTTTSFTVSSPNVTEKTSKDSEEPNFVTILLEYSGAKFSIDELWPWLMELMNANEDTQDLVELTKYLVYMATGTDYGVTEYDFESLYESAYESLTSVSSGDFIVNTEMSDSSIVITDLETLKTAFSGYTTSAKLIEYAEYFLEYQEEYKVNAVFAAVVSIKETTAGTKGHATDGKNNWFNIDCTCGNSSHGKYETYSSAQESIEAFFALIAKEGSESVYFGQGLYTVSEIGAVYCPNTPDYPTQADSWIEFVTEYMTKMFNAVGISTLSSASEVADGTSEEKLAYLFPNGTPTTASEASTYMSSISVPITTKDRNEDNNNRDCT